MQHCLSSVIATSRGLDKNIVVLDNKSYDTSVATARRFGAKTIVKRCSLCDAYAILFNLSRCPYTLLIHADIIMLSNKWFELCTSKMDDNVVLISPQDIGCGPYTRPFGIGKPESSFLFFNTKKARRLRIIRWKRFCHLPYPILTVDFYGDHITHNLSEYMKKLKLSWFPMEVHISNMVSNPIYIPKIRLPHWYKELSYLQYGLGNFYSIDGIITHYHNWYDRALNSIPSKVLSTIQKDFFPLDYIKTYTEAFLKDYISGNLSVPPAIPSKQEPRLL